MNHLKAKTGYFRSKIQFGVFSILLLFTATAAFAQNTITGTIINPESKPLPNVEIYNKTSGQSFSANAKGGFTLKAITAQTLVFYTEDYVVLEQSISPSDTPVTITLQKVIALDEVLIQKEKFFALNKLKDIDGTTINAGTKIGSYKYRKANRK